MACKGHLCTVCNSVWCMTDAGDKFCDTFPIHCPRCDPNYFVYKPDSMARYGWEYEFEHWARQVRMQAGINDKTS